MQDDSSTDQNDFSITPPEKIPRRTFIKRTAATVLVFGIGAYAYGADPKAIDNCSGSKGKSGSGGSGAANTGTCTITLVPGSMCGDNNLAGCYTVAGAGGSNNSSQCIEQNDYGKAKSVSNPGGLPSGTFCVKMEKTPTP